VCYPLHHSSPLWAVYLRIDVVVIPQIIMICHFCRFPSSHDPSDVSIRSIVRSEMYYMHIDVLCMECIKLPSCSANVIFAIDTTMPLAWTSVGPIHATRRHRQCSQTVEGRYTKTHNIKKTVYKYSIIELMNAESVYSSISYTVNISIYFFIALLYLLYTLLTL